MRGVRAAARPRLVVAALVVAAVLPLALHDALRLAHLTEWLTFALAAVGLGLAVGIGGLPSLSQGAFVAIGAFAAALLQSRAGWPAPAAAVAALGRRAGRGRHRPRGRAAAARVRAVATWLLAWLVAVALPAFPRVSGGVDGIVVPNPAVPVWALYEVALALLAVALGLFALFARGLPGLALAAVRQRPAGAVALGVPKAHVRLVAFTLAAALGGLAGALEVQVAGVADPASYDPVLSFELLAAVVLAARRRRSVASRELRSSLWRACSRAP
jgi:branched-chain amino acid transport system permease protein